MYDQKFSWTVSYPASCMDLIKWQKKICVVKVRLCINFILIRILVRFLKNSCQIFEEFCTHLLLLIKSCKIDQSYESFEIDHYLLFWSEKQKNMSRIPIRKSNDYFNLGQNSTSSLFFVLICFSILFYVKLIWFISWNI